MTTPPEKQGGQLGGRFSFSFSSLGRHLADTAAGRLSHTLSATSGAFTQDQSEKSAETSGNNSAGQKGGAGGTPRDFIREPQETHDQRASQRYGPGNDVGA